MGFFDMVINWLTTLTSTQTYVMIGAALEMFLRLIKTDKPASLLHLASAFLGRLGDVCKKLADVIDGILPQNLK